MAVEGMVALKDSRVAGGNLSALQYHFVKLDGDGEAVACTAATDVPYGVLQNNPTEGQMAEIVIIGITKVVADETLGEGQLISTADDGKAALVAPGTDTTVYIVGQVRNPGAVSEVITVVVNCASPARGA